MAALRVLRRPVFVIVISLSLIPLLPFCFYYSLSVPYLRLHRSDEITKRLPKVLGLLSPQTLYQLAGEMRRALHLWQKVVTEEFDRFLTSSLECVPKQHRDFKQHLHVSFWTR